jgi:hypothetical protein
MMQQLSNLNKVGGKIVLWLLILSMLGYTVVRSLHFLQQTLPPDQQYVAFLALAAFDLGVLGWLYYAMHSASGVNQRVIAYGMVFVCCGGVIVTTISDMLIVSDKNGMIAKMPPYTATVALWTVMAVIALNFLAGILTHLVDTKHVKHMAVESARDQITAASLAAIVAKAAEIAPQIAERVAFEWQNDIIREMVGHLPAMAAQMAVLPAADKIVQGSISPAPAVPGAQQPERKTEPLQNAPEPVPVAPGAQQPEAAPGAPRRRFKHFHKRTNHVEPRVPPAPKTEPLETPAPAAKKKLTPVKTRQAESTAR